MPSGTGTCATPAAESHESAVQGLPSSTLAGAPGVHTPDWHVSAPLHWLSSGQAVPFAAGPWTTPDEGSHESAVHGLPSSTGSGVPGVHVPDWQVSVPLQTLPSVQFVPFETTTWVTPVTGLQESAVHGLLSSTTGALPAVQVPAWHVSAPLQTVPSAHAVPLALAGFEHWPLEALQVPASWQESEPTQTTGLEPTQVPAWHWST